LHKDEHVPELPEVETVVRELRPRLVGHCFTHVQVGRLPLRRQWSPVWETALGGRSVKEIRRRGKWIVLRLDNGLHLVIHLGMTGQLTVVPAMELPQPHTHMILHLNGGEHQLRFRDIRRFGSATLFESREQLEEFFEATGLGPEPFDLDRTYWRSRLRGTKRNLKAVLLDQRVAAGVGNIYADESLFEARLHPALLARELSPAAAERLRQAVITVLKRAIDKRGSSIRNYVGGSGLRGSYQDEFRVYGRTGEPCVHCGRAIACIRLAGRATHFCPRCQRPGYTSRKRKRRAKPSFTLPDS
jgi:formamidopyrimidine-DNA glycosylase